MTIDEQRSRMPLRLRIVAIIAAVQAIVAYAVPAIVPDSMLISVVGGLACGFAILVWWLLFSRTRWIERVGVILLMIGAMLMTRLVIHESLAGAGMGRLIYFLALPGLCLALGVWAVVTYRLGAGARGAWLLVAFVLACVPWVMLRTAGIRSGGSEFHWRWTPTPEERLLAQGGDEPRVAPVRATERPANAPAAPVPVPAPAPEAGAAPAPKADAKRAAAPTAASTTKSDSAETVAPPAAPSRPAAWPGFRGPDRDGVIRGVRIRTDWSASPPAMIWRRAVGPGWSSFAVDGDVLYTQEQRGDDEIVAAYKVSTGEPVWRHRDAARFYESNGGPGPRGTPTVSNGRVFAFGATGILNALDAATGAVLWSHNVATDTGRQIPGWGFASSPLVIDNVVIVAASGTMAGYDVATGKPRWTGPRLLTSYSSPHRTTIDGVEQVVFLSGSGAAGLAPATGQVLWQHEWDAGSPIVQPAPTADGVLVNAITMTGGIGVRRLAIEHDASGWKVNERWTSNGLKPYFNDFVVHKGHAFGFDGNILSCINLEDGARKWKGGRYGNGQLVLLREQDLLLVISEEGELALVGATPDQYKELARVPALEGKTWNHPALVGDVLLVRNGEQMAAFRLTLAGAGDSEQR